MIRTMGDVEEIERLTERRKKCLMEINRIRNVLGEELYGKKGNNLDQVTQ